MKVPKYIKETIKDIEHTGERLRCLEQELYSWIEKKDISIDTEDVESLDLELNLLFQNHDGKELLKRLEELDI